MGRKLRYLPDDTHLVEVTCRAIQRRFLLRPSPQLNAVILGTLARFQQRHGMRICAVVYLSNHCHLLLRPRSARQLAAFMRDVNSKIAREVGRLHGWREKVWGRRYTDIVTSHEPEALIGRLRYLLEQVGGKVRRFTGDGAYDRRLVYDTVAGTGAEHVVVVVPPRRSAVPDKNAEGAWSQRDSHLHRIEQIGRQAWLKETRYRQQARAENAFFRWKLMLGDRLRSKHFKSQRREAMIGCRALNRMFELGKPRSQAVAA